MPVTHTDSDNVSTVHTAERLEIKFTSENVEDFEINVYFNVSTQLPSGKLVVPNYWDSEPLKLTCKDNPELAQAMAIIQQAIGQGRYMQITAPTSIITENQDPPLLSEQAEIDKGGTSTT